MSRAFLRCAVLWLGLLFAALPAWAEMPCLEWSTRAQPSGGDDSGMGGTGRTLDDSGIGGTGRSGGEDSGVGGTGIYGSITGFGSVCLNGLRVHHDDETQVTINTVDASASHLEVGQVLWVQAQIVDGTLRAESIAVHSAVVGRVSAIDPAGRSMRISGIDVHVPDGVGIFDEHDEPTLELTHLRVGEVLDVSGLPDSTGGVVATRVQRRDSRIDPYWRYSYAAPALGELVRSAKELRWLSLEGHVREGLAGSVRIAGFDVDASALAGPPPGIGERVWIRGQIAGTRLLRAEQLAPVPLLPEPSSQSEPTPRVAPPTRRGPLDATDAPRIFESAPADEKPSDRNVLAPARKIVPEAEIVAPPVIERPPEIEIQPPIDIRPPVEIRPEIELRPQDVITTPSDVTPQRARP